MKKVIYLALIGIMLIASNASAAEDDSSKEGLIRYLPYIIAGVIYILSLKFKPKKPQEERSEKKNRHSIREIGPQDTNITYQGYEKNYDPIEPK